MARQIGYRVIGTIKGVNIVPVGFVAFSTIVSSPLLLCFSLVESSPTNGEAKLSGWIV